MKSNLINYTDKGLKKLLIEEILRINPLLTLGDDMTGQVVATMCDGRCVDYHEPVTVKTIQFDKLPEGLINPEEKRSPNKTVTCEKQIRVNMKDMAEKKLPAELNLNLTQPTYLHFSYVKMPHREWLEEYEIGDMVFITTYDEAYNQVATPVTLTQEIMDDHSYVFFRYALS